MAYETLNQFFQRVNDAADPAKELATANKWHQLYIKHAFQFESMNLPEGIPPFKVLEGNVDIAPTKLLTPYAARQIDSFYGEMLNQLRRETKFIQFLEGLSEEEANVFVDIKDKMITEKYPNITPELVDTVFPTLITPVKL